MYPTLSAPRFLPWSVVTAVLLLGSADAQTHGPSSAHAPTGALQERPLVSAPHLADAPPDASILTRRETRLDHERVFFDQREGGVVWARGADYKMGCGPDGVTYFPRFGPEAPRNIPLALSPDRVTLAGEPLVFERAANATRTDNRIELRRGAFIEAYDLAPASIEQTFVFESLPRVGELVVRIPVGSELAGYCDETGVEFRGELGRVTYSRAVALDATGRRVPARTELVDGVITIRVDSGFVETAVMPLVIDPVIATFPIDDSAVSAFAADVAWDETYWCWLAVYEVIFSASDHDIYARIMNYDGTVRHSGYVDSSSDNWSGPSCASLNAYNQCLVVAAVTSPVLTSRIVGRLVSTLDLALLSPLTISGFFSGFNPVVGGDPYPVAGSASYYCVAWETENYGSPPRNDIQVRLVAPDNTLVPGSHQVLSDSNSAWFNRNADISKSNGGNEWMIVWESRNSPASFSSDIMGGRVNWNGVLTTSDFFVAFNYWSSNQNPSVSSPLAGTNDYLVAYEERNSSTSDADIRLTMFDGSTIVAHSNLSAAEMAVLGRDQIEPCVDTDGSHFLVAYSENTQGLEYDIYASEVATVGNELPLVQGRQLLASSSTPERRPSVAGLRPAGEMADYLQHDYILAWDDNYSPGLGDIEGVVYRGLVGGPKTPFCFGTSSLCPCGNAGAPGHGCSNSLWPEGGLLSATGDASVFGDTVVLSAAALTGSSAFFFQGEAQSSPVVFDDGLTCVSGAVIRLGRNPISSAASSYPQAGDLPVSVRGAVPLTGASRYYQCVYRNAAAFCTPSTSNRTNAIKIYWTL